MRSGGCSIQQSLTPEATTIVKQAITLARRRGHAQVTPIHVASVMLASPVGLLRAACLKSNSHPFQCKALELCFNVSLNRLPTSMSGPILGPHVHYPAIANALMAAFKRAQAHQRRGSIESQQNPILALKIETQQLVVSILDDPSVSRVMKEAGFSSTLVKSNVEQAVASLDSNSQANVITTPSPSFSYSLNTTQTLPYNHLDLTFSNPIGQARTEDVSGVIESWVRKREKSSIVVVGECLDSCEGVVRGVKERVERGDVPLELRYVQFLNCPLLSMKNLSREEIDLKLGEIRCLLKGCLGRGVVLYLGDLRWVAEYWAYYGEQREHYYYCPVEHLIMGLRRIVVGNNVENGRIWLMGIATFNTLIKCKSGIPSLESLLDLHALTIPDGSLELTLNLDNRSLQDKNKNCASREYSWPIIENKVELPLTCCSDCSANCRIEVRCLSSGIRNPDSTTSTPTSSRLPSWLQKCKEDSRESSINDQEETMEVNELCNKWNLICKTTHKHTSNYLEKTINFSYCSPTSSTSISSYETKPIWPLASKEYQSLATNKPKPDLLSNPNSIPNSASSSEATEIAFETQPLTTFKENNPENFENLCSALERSVPWKKDIIPEIASTVLRCRSGKEKQNRMKHETWLFFLGVDDESKIKLARELARIIFGSQTSFKSIGLSSFLSTTGDSNSKSCKRVRDESSDQNCLDKIANEVKQNPHRVFYMEDIENLDQYAQKGIENAIKSGKISMENGQIVELEDAIVIFSCDSFSSASRACSPPIRQKVEDKKDGDDLEDASSSLNLDLNISVGYGHASEQQSLVGDGLILESVDKQVFFKIQVL